MYSNPNVGFWQWVQSMRDPELIVLPIFFLALALVVTSGLVINAMHRRRLEVDLKRELLERGLSADEIATVVSASKKSPWLCNGAGPANKGELR
jgi:hypothetical protein